MYLDQRVLLVFFLDSTSKLLGSIIAPGLITLQVGGSYVCFFAFT